MPWGFLDPPTKLGLAAASTRMNAVRAADAMLQRAYDGMSIEDFEGGATAAYRRVASLFSARARFSEHHAIVHPRLAAVLEELLASYAERALAPSLEVRAVRPFVHSAIGTMLTAAEVDEHAALLPRHRRHMLPPAWASPRASGLEVSRLVRHLVGDLAGATDSGPRLTLVVRVVFRVDESFELKAVGGSGAPIVGRGITTAELRRAGAAEWACDDEEGWSSAGSGPELHMIDFAASGIDLRGGTSDGAETTLPPFRVVNMNCALRLAV